MLSFIPHESALSLTINDCLDALDQITTFISGYRTPFNSPITLALISPFPSRGKTGLGDHTGNEGSGRSICGKYLQRAHEAEGGEFCRLAVRISGRGIRKGVGRIVGPDDILMVFIGAC